MLKRTAKTIGEIIVVLAALATILYWLGIKPGDFRVLTPEHWVWLALAGILFATGIGSSARSWYLSAIRIRQLEQRCSKYNEEVQQRQTAQAAEREARTAQAQAESKCDGLRNSIETLNTQITEQKQRAEEYFKNWNDEVRSHGETKAREREANTFRTRTEKELADCKEKLNAVDPVTDQFDRIGSMVGGSGVKTREKTPSRTPYLLIDYLKQPGGELLTFRNTGEVPLHYLRVGPLTWEMQKTITIPNVIPPIAPGVSHQTQMFFEREPHSGYPLYDYMRSETPHDADTFVITEYEDSHGTKCQQKFSLTTSTKSGISWQPGPVVLL